MTHVRSKAAVALVAALLASCSGVDDRLASRPAETPQVSQVPPTQQPAQPVGEAVVTSDTRVPWLALRSARLGNIA